MGKTSTKLYIAVLFFTIILASILYLIILSSSEMKYQRYVLLNIDTNSFISRIKELAKNDSNLITYIDPCNRTSKKITVADNSKYKDVWKMNLYLKKLNCIVEFALYINNDYFDLEKVLILNSKTKKWSYIYDEALTPEESHAIKQSFERNILDKVCSYKKVNSKYIYIWYTEHYIEIQNYILGIMVFAIIIYIIASKLLKTTLKKAMLAISLILFLTSLFMPCCELANSSPLITINNRIFSIVAFIFGWFEIVNNNITGWVWCANILYILSIIFYLRNKSNQKIIIGLAIVLAMSFLLCTEIKTSNGNTVPIINLCIGYYMWVSSFIILLIGMLLTRKIKR